MMPFGNDHNFFKKLQQFLDKYADEYKTVEEAMDAFLEQNPMNDLDDETVHDLNNLFDSEFTSGFDDTPDMESMRLLEQAVQLPEGKKREDLITQALRLWPENWYAHLERIDGSDVEIIEQLRDLEVLAKESWLETEQAGWLNFEERPYLTLKFSLARTLLSQGLLLEAADHFEELYELDEMDSLGARYSLMSIYCRLYDWESAVELFYDVPYPANSDELMIVPLLVLAILTGNTTYAKDLFYDLEEANEDIGYLFTDYGFPVEQIMGIDEAAPYQPGTFSALSVAFKDIFTVLIDSDYLYNWMLDQYQAKSRHQKININDKVISFEGAASHFNGGNRKTTDAEESVPVLEDVVYNAAEALFNLGLVTQADFSDYTEKEILQVKNVGPKTIEQLKKNGVVFKKEK